MHDNWYIVWGAVSFYALDAWRNGNERLIAFQKNPRKNWKSFVLDVVIFTVLAYSFVANLLIPKSPREAFLAGATWEVAVLAILEKTVKGAKKSELRAKSKGNVQKGTGNGSGRKRAEIKGDHVASLRSSTTEPELITRSTLRSNSIHNHNDAGPNENDLHMTLSTEGEAHVRSALEEEKHSSMLPLAHPSPKSSGSESE